MQSQQSQQSHDSLSYWIQWAGFDKFNVELEEVKSRKIDMLESRWLS